MKKFIDKFKNHIKNSTDKNNIKSLFTSRAFRVGSYSTFATIAVIAIAFVINMIVGQLPSNIIQIDFTKNQLYTVSEQTKQIVSSLDTDVEIYFITQGGSEDSGITKLLERYESLSDKIKVIKKDPVVYPNFAKQYTSDTIYNNSIVVVSGNKSKYISNYDIYVTDYSNYYTDSTHTTNFNGENCLTSAIDYVSNDNLPKLYTLTGHGELTTNSTVESSIKNENIETESLNLLTVDSVPNDADCLFIYGPSSDISDAEKEKILTYLGSGGNLMLITDYSDVDTPNLSEIAQYYGVRTVDGLVIEGNANNCIRNYNHYLLPNINSHKITSPLKDSGYFVLMPIAQGIKQLENKRSTVNVTELLNTSNKSYSKSNVSNITSLEKEEGDISGPFALGVAITESVGDEETNIVWYTTSQLLDDKVNQMVSGGNFDLFLNSLGWMCERENTISIHAKSLDTEHLTVSSSSASYWSLILVGIIPIGFVTAGIYVLMRRKHR